MRVIVCGGRMFGEVPDDTPLDKPETAKRKAARERAFVYDTLDTYDLSAIAEGGADGADRMAREWAGNRTVRCLRYYAHWHLHGKAAGPIRNAQMLDEFKPDAVIAFPGGKGTADMVRRAKAAGVRVIEVEEARDAMIARGLADAAAGRVTEPESFAQYVDEEARDE